MTDIIENNDVGPLGGGRLNEQGKLST